MDSADKNKPLQPLHQYCMGYCMRTNVAFLQTKHTSRRLMRSTVLQLWKSQDRQTNRCTHTHQEKACMMPISLARVICLFNQLYSTTWTTNMYIHTSHLYIHRYQLAPIHILLWAAGMVVWGVGHLSTWERLHTSDEQIFLKGLVSDDCIHNNLWLRRNKALSLFYNSRLMLL